MVAAPRAPAAQPSKKRRPPTAAASGPPKKRSPLFDKPQNRYAPPAAASMTKEELMAWRKEQRRQRNRESAAKSRNQHRHRIEELEREAGRWKTACRDLEARLRCMERQIELLTHRHQADGRGAALPATSPAVVSQPASPSRSPPPAGSQVASSPRSPLLSSPPILVAPTDVTSLAPPLPTLSSRRASHAHLFPPLLSDPKDFPPVVHIEAAAATSDEESRKHLTPISRQA